MRTLIYKMKHEGDPNQSTGVFGCYGCMGRVRGWAFDAVIGIGGIGAEATASGLNGKLTWIGVGAHKAPTDTKPLVLFDHFIYFGQNGLNFRAIAPTIAARMYDRNTRSVTDVGFSSAERDEVAKILVMADGAPSSPRKKQQGTGELRTKRCGVQRCRAARERCR